MFREAPAPAGDTLLRRPSRVHFFQKVPHNLHPCDDHFQPATGGARKNHRCRRISKHSGPEPNGIKRNCHSHLHNSRIMSATRPFAEPPRVRELGLFHWF